MPKAARKDDRTVCPLVDPGPKPHVGGPIEVGCATVQIEGKDAARVGDVAKCEGDGPDPIARGSATVMIGGPPAARVSDLMSHGGSIIGPGASQVLIGDGTGSCMCAASGGGTAGVAV